MRGGWLGEEFVVGVAGGRMDEIWKKYGMCLEDWCGHGEVAVRILCVGLGESMVMGRR